MEEQLEQQSQDTGEVALNDQAPAVEGGDSTVSAPEAPATFDIDGKQYTADEIKQGFSRHDDYTRKTQDVAKQKDELKPYVEIQNYWNNMVKTNPQKAQAVYNAMYGQDGEADPRDLKLQQVEHQMQGIVSDNAKRDAQGRIDKIKASPEYGGLFNKPKMEEFLLATALQKNDLNLKDTADEIHKEIVGMRADTKLETEKQIKDNLKSPTRKGVAGSDTKAPPASFDPSKASDKSLREAALKML